MEKYLKFLIPLPPLLIILAFSFVAYELAKPDFDIEHEGVIVLYEETGKGYVILFADGYVMLLEHRPYWSAINTQVKVTQGRGGFTYWEGISHILTEEYIIYDRNMNLTDFNITDLTPLFGP